MGPSVEPGPRTVGRIDRGGLRTVSPDESEAVHDLGTVLNVGQDLCHRFEITNATDRPIRLLRASPFAPCCSSVGPLPDLVAPGDRASVPVVFRPGLRSGPHRVEYLIETDDPGHPRRTLALRVDLLPTLLIDEIGDHHGTLDLGQAGSRAFRITCRRGDGGGRPLPESVEADDPLRAAFVGEVRERTLEGEQVEAVRDVAVTIPASGDPGHRKGVLRLRWPDVAEHEVPIAWKVVPPLDASPSGFVLKAADGVTSRAVVVCSSGRPFRITSVDGPLLAEPCMPGDRSAMAHTLRLSIDPASATGPDPTEIRIATDHPDQADVVLSVLVLPPSEGAQP